MNDYSVSKLKRTQNNYQKLKKRFSLTQHLYLYCALPSWAREFSEYAELKAKMAKLYKEGTIRWGAYVMANNLLFDSSNNDACPGIIVHAMTDAYENKQSEIIKCTQMLGRLPEQEDKIPEDQRETAKLLDGNSHFSHFRLPDSLTDGNEFYLSNMMFFPKHLPGNSLDYRAFPILTHNEVQAIHMLPSYFWDSRII
ncbi:MAG: hypothetical protein HRT88_11115 [Lentisphaeraceae bacterium]|nr:hypothetical protein [Lentisphaeraceae bacterium]